MSISTRRRRRGLVELLVLIAIIGVLVALLLPAVGAARKAARDVQRNSTATQVTPDEFKQSRLAAGLLALAGVTCIGCVFLLAWSQWKTAKQVSGQIRVIMSDGIPRSVDNLLAELENAELSSSVSSALLDRILTSLVEEGVLEEDQGQLVLSADNATSVERAANA